jgi:hypothetical protein
MKLDLDVQLKRVETNRTAEGVDKNTEVEFNVNSSISESERGPGFVNLKYSIDLETEPAAARLFVSGNAVIKGSEDDIDQLLAARERDGTPIVFMKVYQRVYPTLYLMCASLNIPFPGPGLLRQNKLETGPQVVEVQRNRAEPIGIER